MAEPARIPSTRASIRWSSPPGEWSPSATPPSRSSSGSPSVSSYVALFPRWPPPWRPTPPSRSPCPCGSGRTWRHPCRRTCRSPRRSR
ncbi:SEC-C metal-binding domain-containing protein [Streptomyces sp. NPDC050988]|uniref:SEC-C metal-binding domain-containing protein n=1 Tax=Streptomyces sp. NPDC050988 TaxID=3365637 RepID=UPI0037A36D2C